MLPLNQILCPIDFSETSRHAMEVATRLSLQLGLPLTLAHVVMPAPYFAADPQVAMALMPDAMLPNDTERAGVAEAEVKSLVDGLRQKGVDAHALVLMGMPGTVLGDRLSQQPGTLTVIGTHGRSAVPRFILGSVAVEIVRRSAGPVMTVREQHPDLPMTHIGVAVDFSAACEPAIEFAAGLARGCGAEITLINIIAPLELLATTEAMVAVQFTEANEVLRGTAQKEMEEIKARLPELTVHSEVVEGQSYYRSLVSVAEAKQLSLLVMGTHGRTGLRRLFLGSVTERTLQVAPCPVVSVKLPGNVPGELSWRDVAEDLKQG